MVASSLIGEGRLKDQRPLAWVVRKQLDVTWFDHKFIARGELFTQADRWSNWLILYDNGKCLSVSLLTMGDC